MKKESRFATVALVLIIVSAMVVVPSLAIGDDPAAIVKTAFTSMDRTYEWTITKSADYDRLTLAVGEQIPVTYAVTVNAQAMDSNWHVSGEISVINNGAAPIHIESLTDVISPDIVPETWFKFTWQQIPFDLSAKWSFPVNYDAALPDGAERVNTATAQIVDETGAAKTLVTTVPVVFDDQTTVTTVDKCIDVTDSYAGFLGTICASETPKTFTYTRWVGPYDACGAYMVKNTASFATSDTMTTGSASWDIPVEVPCGDGCTLTPGYWKTHSAYGPAPYDATWAQIGENTPFFGSGQSYYQALWTSPKGGNAYYILAHAYIAAELNVLNEASIPGDVLAAWNRATEILGAYTPEQIADMGKKDPLRAEMITLAELLDNYNNGIVGPGHCTE